MNITKTYTLAVVGKETYPISTEGPMHKIVFGTIPMDPETFRETFFDKYNLLCISKTCSTKIEGNNNFTSCPAYTSSDGSFNLYDCLIDCATSDLNFAKITPVSKIEVKKDINGIEYLADLRIVSGLRWSDVNESELVTNGNVFSVIAVFTNPNPNVKNVVLEFNYEIVETSS